MKNLLKAELYKLAHNKSIWIIVAVLCGFCSISIFTGVYDNGLVAFTSLMKDIMPVLMGLLVYAGFLIASDFSNRTLSQYVSAGHSRTNIVTAKLIAYIIGSFVITVLYPVICVLLTSVVFGWGTSAWKLIFLLLKFVFMRFPLYMGSLSMFFLLNSVIRNVVGAMGVSLAVLIGGTVFVNNAYSANPDSILSYFPIVQLQQFSDPANINKTAWLISIAVSMVMAAFYMMCTLIIYNRQELK